MERIWRRRRVHPRVLGVLADDMKGQRMIRRGLLAGLLVFIPSLSLAQAATVGPNCKATWGAPTTNTDGSPVTAGEITNYRVYVDKATITPNSTVPTITVAGNVLTAQICAGLAAGNHTVAVSAVAGPNEGPP